MKLMLPIRITGARDVQGTSNEFLHIAEEIAVPKYKDPLYQCNFGVQYYYHNVQFVYW